VVEGRTYNVGWLVLLYACERRRKIRSSTNAERMGMKCVQPMQCIPPRGNYDTHSAMLVHNSTFRGLNFRRLLSTSRISTNERFSYISATSSNLRHVSREGIDSGRRLGRGVRMDRKFGRGRQGGGSGIRTWLSMP
jgi:hypothetical protein